MLTADQIDAYHREGWVVVDDFIEPSMLAEAVAGIEADHPTAADYFADPGAYPRYTESQFSGIKKFPFSSFATNRLGVCDEMLTATAQLLGTRDMRMSKGELWAKYSGAIDYEQAPHRDFGNHTLVVPRADHRYKEVTTFVFLSDVDLTSGPTAVIPRPFTDDIPLGINRLSEDAVAELKDREVVATGRAGSVLFYSYEVFHRGTQISGDREGRFMALFDYHAADAPWIARQGWPEYGNYPAMREFMERITPEHRALFDVPLPGHEYWNEQTIADMQRRYPGMDVEPYRLALS